MSTPHRARHPTTNWRGYNRALGQRGSMLIFINPDMQLFAAPQAGCTGLRILRPAIRLCLPVGVVRAVVKLAGRDWPMPDFGTLGRRQKTLAVQIRCSGRCRRNGRAAARGLVSRARQSGASLVNLTTATVSGAPSLLATVGTLAEWVAGALS